jgi:hypothetical protein
MRLNATHERWLIVLVALHSYSIGAMFFFLPGWTVRFAGWDGIDPLFFAHQAAAFHVALASAYLIEYFRYRGVAVLVTAKSVALVFLLLSAVFSSVPWAVPFSGLADGAMALVVVLTHRAVRTSM